MGFTQYFNRAPKLSTDAFKAFVGDVKALAGGVEGMGIKLAGGDGTGEAEIGNNQIWLNGAGEDSYETFFIERELIRKSWQTPDESGKYFEFCKTGRKPYDLMVVACLFAARYRFGSDFSFSSDGGVSELGAGYDLWLKTCNPVNPPTITALLLEKS